MMYPYLTLDEIEIVHSDIKSDGSVKVYVEKPVDGGFDHATCWLPEYRWEDIVGFSENELSKIKKLVENNSHVIMELAQEGGFINAAGI